MVLRDNPVNALTVGSLTILCDMLKPLKRLMETIRGEAYLGDLGEKTFVIAQ
jgi:hypothetical protein